MKKHGRLLAHLHPCSVTPCPRSLKTYLAVASTAPIIPSRVAHNKRVKGARGLEIAGLQTGGLCLLLS